MKFKLNLLFTLFCILLCSGLYAQTIEGIIVDRVSKTPISYANVYNEIQENGTISNDEGYFKLKINSWTDNILISFIGYQDYKLTLEKGKNFYTISMDESTQLLQQIIVTPKDDSYLFDLLFECKKNAKKPRVDAKAYYELKTFRNNKQVELVENFYNTNLYGPDISQLKLKAGRLAMQQAEDRFFGSLGGSNAINILKLYDNNDYFPNSPIDLSKKKSKRNFYLSTSKKYLDNQQDSIYIINFDPKKQDTPNFSGQVWVNKSDFTILKIALNCEDCIIHPFLPLFPTDSIQAVDFNITKTFQEHEGAMVFNHIDFFYTVDYKSRIGYDFSDAFTVKTKAVLYAYDVGNRFYIPDVYQNNSSANDYRKINGIPYNDFFWEANNEYSLNDQKQRNKQFYYHPSSINNQKVFSSFSSISKGLFRNPYIIWNGERVDFNEVAPDTVETENDQFISDHLSRFNEQKYNLAVDFFMDINRYQDSTHVLTATIFDPFDSFYYLTIDNQSRCFINLFFDWCEIQRRKLQPMLEQEKDPNKVVTIFNDFKNEFETQKKTFLKEAQEGENKKFIRKINEQVLTELGIDNISLYKPWELEHDSESDER